MLSLVFFNPVKKKKVCALTLTGGYVLYCFLAECSDFLEFCYHGEVARERGNTMC